MIDQEDIRLWNQLVAVEKRSGQTDAPPVESVVDFGGSHRGTIQQRDSGTPKNHDGDNFQWITRKVLVVTQLTASAESHAKSLLLSLDEIRKHTSLVNDLIDPAMRDDMRKVSDGLVEKLDLLSHRTQVIMNDVQFIEKRAQAQQSAIHSIYQRT